MVELACLDVLSRRGVGVNEKLCILGLCAGLGVFGCSASSDNLSKPPGHSGAAGSAGASGAGGASTDGAAGAAITTGLGGMDLGLNVVDSGSAQSDGCMP